ncbi:mannose-6-phosphate isomerase, class I [Microbacterium sp. ZW T5_45]|uniref:mannose-6-phosphate isomerase, class I n=1 Tax=Microbacterium sp. ZW T5_45 TaxID=3378080 RepID=UPI0038519F09
MLIRLTNTPRDYAWGSRSLLAALEGREPSTAPEAEVWFGDHPGDPADVDGGGTLDAVTGGELPYLLKLLAAASPLSIQVHPTVAQAQAGWEREAPLAMDDPDRSYRDANHKPELIVALSDRFESLSGLRPVADTLRLLDALDAGAVASLREHLQGEGDVLRSTIGWLLSGEAEIAPIIDAVRAAASAPGEWRETLQAVARIADAYPGDPGVIVALLMNYIVLSRGEGVFLRAGLLHAYIAGLGVEIMAASDNVLRGGLTPKRIDVPELLAVLDATPGEVPILRPDTAGAVTEYPVDVPDFALRRVSLAGEDFPVAIDGPTMVLATAGAVAATGADGAERSIPVGAALFASADEDRIVLRGEGEVFLATPGR